MYLYIKFYRKSLNLFNSYTVDVVGKTSSFLSQILLKRSEKREYQTIQTWDMKFLCCWNDMGKSTSFLHFEFLRILKISLTRQVKFIFSLK